MSPRSTESRDMQKPVISEREKAIARRYASGETCKQVASELFISPSTVRNHVANIYRKLAVNNKPQLLQSLAQADLTAPVTGMLEQAQLPAVNGASIAVLPLKNAGSPNHNHLVAGVTNSIHNYLTRHHDLFVSGRSSCETLAFEAGGDASSAATTLGVRYVVLGTVLFEGSSVRIHIKLVDGISGAILWTDDFHNAPRSIQRLESDIAVTIAATLSLKIDDSQYESRKNLSPAQLLAYDWRLRGNKNLEAGGLENFQKARYEFKKALELEPDSAAAYSGLSMSYGYECDQLLADDYNHSLSRHLQYAEAAIRTDDADSRGHYAMGCALSMYRRYHEADSHSVRALELNPGEYHNLCCRGYTLMALGELEASVACFNESLRRNPLAPNSCLFALGLIEYLREKYGQAAYIFSRLSQTVLQKDSSLAATYGQLGYSEIAKIAGQEFQDTARRRSGYPAGASSKEWRQYWERVYAYLRPGELEHVLDGINKSGFPV